MKLRIKSKLSLGLTFLFTVIVLTGVVGMYAINLLSDESKNIFKTNYEDIVYLRNIRIDIDKISKNIHAGNKPDTGILNNLEKNIAAQENNITDSGEKETALTLHNLYSRFKQNDTSLALLSSMRTPLNDLGEFNLNSIVAKSNETQHLADKAKLYFGILVTICFLLAFSFLLNFPGYIANPIKELTEGIKQIANKNYSQRINIAKGDEFGELAENFNSMAKQLNDYENSNLAKIIFEKKRIDTIINGMKDPIIGLDENKNILFVNTTAIEILGINEQELIGKYAPDIAEKNDLLRTLISENESPAPLKIYADTKESYFSKEILNIKAEDKAIGSVVLLRNITQFKELDLAKTNFIATISHELKTPIASIKMGLKLLEDGRTGAINDDQKKLITDIKDDAQRLLSITGELLDLAQVESGNISLDKQQVEPHSIIDYANNALKVQAEQKHLTIKINCPSDLPTVNCDLEKTAWVMVNFLSNAIRYSPENAEVVMEAKTIPGAIVFSTTDHGKGISFKYIDMVFEKFNKIPDAQTGKTGSGLGLSISKEFIIAQGGKIWVESKPNTGSTFLFQLPI